MPTIGKKLEDVQKFMEFSRLFVDYMYFYIEESVYTDLPLNFISKQAFIFVYKNTYSCEKKNSIFPLLKYLWLNFLFTVIFCVQSLNINVKWFNSYRNFDKTASPV